MSRILLTDQQRRCFDIIVAAAEAGDRCPTSVDIADRMSTSPSYIDSVFIALAHKGYITIKGTVKGRIVTVRKTGKKTARIDAMPHWSRPEAARVDIMPKRPVEPGRYLLDTEGRLQPMRYSGFVKAVAIVTVKARIVTPEISPEKPAERVEVVEPVKALSKPIIVPERRPDPILRPMARKTKPTPVRVPIDVMTDGEDDPVAEFERKLAEKRAERAKRLVPVAKVDAMRLAQALRQRDAKPAPKPVKKPAKYAQSREACRFCGIPGWRGCEHFLPFEGAN